MSNHKPIINSIIITTLFYITIITGLIITTRNNHEITTINKTSIITQVIITITLLILLIKLGLNKLMKTWFAIAVIISITATLSTFINEVTALITSIIITIIRLSTRDEIIHNITELLIYGGLVKIISPYFNMQLIMIILIITSIYDYISVKISKHMITIAKQQQANNTLNGLIVTTKEGKSLIGGGDITLSLLYLTIIARNSILNALIGAQLITLSILILTLIGKEGKYYPAMPAITISAIITQLII